MLHVVDDDLLMPVAQPRGRHAGRARGAALAAASPEAAVAATARDRDARDGLKGKRSAILLGHYAQQHPDFAVLLAIAQEIGRVTGATVGVLPDGANAVGAHLAGAVPTRRASTRARWSRTPRRGYLVAGVEAELDMGAGGARGARGVRSSSSRCRRTATPRPTPPT